MKQSSVEGQIHKRTSIFFLASRQASCHYRIFFKPVSHSEAGTIGPCLVLRKWVLMILNIPKSGKNK